MYLVLGVTMVFGLSILDSPFGFIYRLFSLQEIVNACLFLQQFPHNIISKYGQRYSQQT